MKRALVLNAGSSTLKWSVLDCGGGGGEPWPIPPLDPTAPAGSTLPAGPASPVGLTGGSAEWESTQPERQAEQVRALLRDNPAARSVDAVGHRVVHGGARFRGPARITPEVRRALGELVEIDPLHTPAALAGIDAVSAAAPELPQVAAFDTAFHATLPEVAATYPLPWEWTARFALRRYGFHGLSVSYASRRIAELLGKNPDRLLVCHLGSGCSLTAVAGGRSLDTSMGFTPLDGVMMATRSGSVDPGLLLHLQRRCGLDLDAIEEGLQHLSGLAGVSGAGADLRQVLAAAAAGSRRAALAYELFVHSLVRMAGAMIAVLGGLDALVLTGGIGEHSACLRADLLARLAYAGVCLDLAANQLSPPPPPQPRHSRLSIPPLVPPAAGRGSSPTGAADREISPTSAGDREISPPGAAVRVFVIAAREDLSILRDLLSVLRPQG